MAHLKPAIEDAVATICAVAKRDGLILIGGNGGSAADSEHMAGELVKSFVLKRPVSVGGLSLQSGLRCIPLSGFPGFATAFANDCDGNLTYAQLINVFGRAGDVFVAFSTSGNSKNVLAAAAVARAKKVKIIALTGAGGGQLREYADILLNVPSDITYQIQELHLPIYHLICLMVESELFAE